MRRPREMALANLAAFGALFLPCLAGAILPPSLRAGGALLLGLWAWALFSALCAACGFLDAGEEHPWIGLWGWCGAAWLERLAAFGVGVLGLAWLDLAFAFYRSAPLPVAVRFGLLALPAAFSIWLAAALLLSLGGAASAERPWRALWKACAFLPLAYAGPGLAALGLFAGCLVLPALGFCLRFWGARLWMAPLLLCPVFTLSFLAAYLTALVRSLLRDALGLPASPPPSWRELWTLWR